MFIETEIHSPVESIDEAYGALTVAALGIPAGYPFYDFLTLFSGIFWTITYILLIYRGFKDKTCGMPLFVLGLNFSWEFIFGFLGEPFISTDGTLFGVSFAHATSQRFDDILWCVFDIALLYLKFKYGKKEYKASMPYAKDAFWPVYIGLQLFVSFWAVFFSVYEWHDGNGVYAAYMQNFFISMLFIIQLFRTGSTKGTNMGIAICKCLGTLAPSLLGALVVVNYYKLGLFTALTFTWLPFTKMLILCCTLMDFFYIFVLYNAIKREGRNPFSLKHEEAKYEAFPADYTSRPLFESKAK